MKKNKLKKTVYIAWFFMLIVSILPEVIIKELIKIEVSNLQEIRIIFMVFVYLISFKIKQLSYLRNFIIVLSVITILNYLGEILQNIEIYDNLFGGINKSFTQALASYQIINLIKAFIMFFVLLKILKKRSNFFLVKGDLRAIAMPIKGMVKNPIPWRKFALQFGIYMTLGLIIFLFVAGGIPSKENIIKILPIFPLILIFAAINSLYEELNFRAAIISTLKNELTSDQALWISSVYFGIIHFYGVPYGIIGVLLATFLGYIIAKSMIESKGFVYAFLLHIIQDIIIFVFLAIGSITAGGV